MKLDKQTLAWFNQSKYWMKMFNPKYQKYMRFRNSGGLAENASLPETLHPSVYNYFNKITNRNEYTYLNYWGFEKWHHSPQLINNNCKCPRCNFDGTSDEWWFMPMGLWDHVT